MNSGARNADSPNAWARVGSGKVNYERFCVEWYMTENDAIAGFSSDEAREPTHRAHDSAMGRVPVAAGNRMSRKRRSRNVQSQRTADTASECKPRMRKLPQEARGRGSA